MAKRSDHLVAAYYVGTSRPSSQSQLISVKYSAIECMTYQEGADYDEEREIPVPFYIVVLGTGSGLIATLLTVFNSKEEVVTYVQTDPDNLLG